MMKSPNFQESGRDDVQLSLIRVHNGSDVREIYRVQ
jgi:hypothetical protein